MLSRRRTLIAFSAPVLALLLGGVVPVGASTSTIVIVTRRSSSLSELSMRELKRLYQAEQVSDPEGNAIIPLNQVAGSPVRVAFDKLVLKMDPDQAGRYWIDRKIRGQRGAPKAIPSVELLRRVVASMAGTIAYLHAADVTAELKVLTIEGKRPTDAGYPLQGR